ncbi:MAG: prephenate dehydrogenase/arogenate dehydrogenase family protein [Planctomycetaceae bacterium]|nr:prephenate dehydrogenase/arogenate dehydrogenase family protein [Planctomycetaceae bacterium]
MGTFLSKIIIVGAGLLGGSLGLALKKRKLAEFVIGVDSNPERLQEALRLGAIDLAATDLAQAFELFGSPAEDRSMLVVCTPVGSIADVILEAAEIVGKRRLLITDVGSTKQEIADKLDKQLPPSLRYIGSHPIAGSEKSGPAHASADLFAGRLTILTPTNEETVAEVTFLEHFWNLLGSSVIQIPPKQHDFILARTSHFPHLISSLLLQTLKTGDSVMVGPGFRSTTRLASSDPGLWTDIFFSNKEAVCDVIAAMQKQLESFRQMLESGNRSGIVKLLTQSKKQRDALEK